VGGNQNKLGISGTLWYNDFLSTLKADTRADRPEGLILKSLFVVLLNAIKGV